MKFVIISHVNHLVQNNQIFGYGPYIREMNIWLKHVEKVEVVANISNREISKIDLAYQHDSLKFTELKSFNLTTVKEIAKTVTIIPSLLITIYKAMKRADHIHLRCPGNVGLLGCLVQILFPNTTKTAKYAGNWDPKAKQPWSYRLQKWILNNTFLTKNMQVLVYGEWEGTSKNIKSFFTATYTNNEATISKQLPSKTISTTLPIQFMFVGTLVHGKRPEYALQLFLEINKINPNTVLNFYGEGKLRPELESFIQKNKLQNVVTLHGNQPKEVVEKAYQNSHFLILASKSEGWPKVVAEAMFWGCVPLSTNVSCVKQMMGHGERGLVLKMKMEEDVAQINQIIHAPQRFEEMSSAGKKWSTNYTLDKFESEIQKLLNTKS